MSVPTRDLVRTSSRYEPPLRRWPPEVRDKDVSRTRQLAVTTPPSRAEQLVATFAQWAPRDEHEALLDFAGDRSTYLADDGSEGTEWELPDGSVVCFSQVDGWSACDPAE